MQTYIYFVSLSLSFILLILSVLLHSNITCLWWLHYSMGHKANVDTSTFRRAIWNYIQSMYGIRHDDYDYREVNVLLERNLKSYIKSLCCYPQRISNDYSKVMRGFRRSEKVTFYCFQCVEILFYSPLFLYYYHLLLSYH